MGDAVWPTRLWSSYSSLLFFYSSRRRQHRAQALKSSSLRGQKAGGQATWCRRGCSSCCS